MQITQKAKLPESELGEDRCFEIGYFGHGDIRMSLWHGDLEHEPINDDGLSSNFGMAHGSDVYILSALAGYLLKAGKGFKEVATTMLDSGKEIVSDAENNSVHSNFIGLDASVDEVSFPRFDIPKHGLTALMVPHPNVPGVLDRVGGTGIYTRTTEADKLLMVLGKLEPVHENGESRTELTDTGDFTESDVPTMTRLICDLAMGEYRKDIHAFLVESFVSDNEE